MFILLNKGFFCEGSDVRLYCNKNENWPYVIEEKNQVMISGLHPKWITIFKEAVDDLCFLLTRGYGENSALSIVGNRYKLNKKAKKRSTENEL